MFIDIEKILSQKKSDKAYPHKYGLLYNLIFTSQYAKKNKPLSVLEIGVNRGYSLEAWGALDEVDKVVGVDSYVKAILNSDGTRQPPRPVRGQRAEGRVRMQKWLQSKSTKDKNKFNVEFLDAYLEKTINFISNKYGQFDIIIDDGPHTWESQEFFLKNYNRLLKDNGVLICEDVEYKHIESILKIRDECNLFIFDLRWNCKDPITFNKCKDEMIIIREK